MIRRILFVFLILSTINSNAQRSNSSPYSFFGIGEEFTPKTVEETSMGGIGVAFFDSHHLNFSNPAANANLRYSTYAFGLLNNDLTIKDNSTTQSSTATSLSYFAIGFPIGKKAGMSFGMQPVSSVGYSLRNEITDINGDLTEITIFSGNGGVNRVYGSIGYKLGKGLSVGLEGDFLFGTITNDIINQRADVALATKYNKIAIIRGGSLKIGAQYQKSFKKDLKLNLGATVKLETNLSSTEDEYIYSLSFSSNGVEIPRDTLSTLANDSEFNIPVKTTLGIGLGKTNKWYTGIEYQFQDAINVVGSVSQIDQTYKYTNASRVSFGGFYIPKINSISSYWNRVTYRAGIRFEQTGLSVNGIPGTTNFTNIDDFGMSFGLGLPLGHQLSNVNVGFEFGKRGTTSDNLIQENYFNLRLSLSLNDVWFKKRKID